MRLSILVRDFLETNALDFQLYILDSLGTLRLRILVGLGADDMHSCIKCRKGESEGHVWRSLRVS